MDGTVLSKSYLVGPTVQHSVARHAMHFARIRNQSMGTEQHCSFFPIFRHYSADILTEQATFAITRMLSSFRPFLLCGELRMRALLLCRMRHQAKAI